MTDQPRELETTAQTVPAADLEETPATDSGRPGVTKIILFAIAGFVVLVLLLFVVALLFAFTNPGAAAGIQIIRDFFIIVLALEGILTGAALVVLVLQVARLTNLLQNEIAPILQQTNDTVKTVRGTATFVSRNVADPVIRASGFFSWLLALVRELFGIRRAVRGGSAPEVEEDGA
jgi:hypothetical protein